MADQFGGPSITAAGSVSANTASTFSFAVACRYGIISNSTGARLYGKLNSGSASTTDRDFVIDDGGNFIWDHVLVNVVTVYVNASSGVNVVGWAG